jgi:hypothetical protein
MILTTQDYVRHYANDRLSGDAAKENRVLTFLEYLFANRTVLFVGYGLAELEILEYVILKARRPPGTAVKESRHYLHPLEWNSMNQTIFCLLRHDATRRESPISPTEIRSLEVVGPSYETLRVQNLSASPYVATWLATL